MPDDQRASYEELAALVVGQAEQIEQLKAEVADLRRQLDQNSRNSSKPPSSDSPFTKPGPRSLRRKSGRKPGGQPGYPGSTLALVDNPHEREAARARPVHWLRRGAGGCTRGRHGAAAGVRRAADDGAGDRTPAHRAPLFLWCLLGSETRCGVLTWASRLLFGHG